jgi:hypothetical protein
MKWWLIVYVFTSDGITAFDIEYDSRAKCRAALVKTIEIRKGYTDHEKKVLECSRYPIPERQTENPEIDL